MVYKALLFACVVVLTIFFFSSSQEPDQGVPAPGAESMSRRSTNVVMVERTHESGRSMEVSAREVAETGDQVARFSDFVIEQEGGPRLSGSDATYDRKSSVLTIHGPLDIEAEQGARVSIDGLIWDREADAAHTDRPVRFEGWDSIVTADRAGFSDGFTTIALTGRVHAKIMQNILDM